MNIEVELRSFISKDKYEELLEFFRKQGSFVKEDCQETYFFDCSQDLRIQKNDFFSKVWLKKGSMHDDQREEIEIRFSREEFDKLEKIFLDMGMNIAVKWMRKRHSFVWKGIDVSLDYTKGYGYILELEKLSSEKEKDSALELLKQGLKHLDIPLTPKQEFDAKYKYYKENWQSLI